MLCCAAVCCAVLPFNYSFAHSFSHLSIHLSILISWIRSLWLNSEQFEKNEAMPPSTWKCMCPILGCAKNTAGGFRRESPWDPHLQDHWAAMDSHFQSVAWNESTPGSDKFVRDAAKRHPKIITREHKIKAAQEQEEERWSSDEEAPAAPRGNSPRRSRSRSRSPREADEELARFYQDVEVAFQSMQDSAAMLRSAMDRVPRRRRGEGQR